MSENNSNIISALAAAVSEVDQIIKSREAAVGRYSYRYAGLGEVVASTKNVLASHGLVALQDVQTVLPSAGVPGGVSISTHIHHVSGDSLSFGPLFLTCDTSSPQAIGSAITYGRRYSLLASLGLATEDDDDAHAAEQSRQAVRPLPQQHPARQREVEDLIERMRAQSDAVKAMLKAFAAKHGRDLKPSTLADPGWRGLVEAELDRLAGAHRAENAPALDQGSEGSKPSDGASVDEANGPAAAELLAEILNADDDVVDALMRYAEERGRGLDTDDLLDPDWRGEVRGEMMMLKARSKK